MCCKFDSCNDEDLIKVVDIQIGQVTTSESAPDTADVYFQATNPTKKLQLTLHVYARPGRNGGGVPGGTHVYAVETWQLYAMAIDNPNIQLNAAFTDGTNLPNPVATAKSLPDSFNVWDGVKLIRGVVHISGLAQPTGDIYKVRAIWEPTDCAMTLAERKHWFAKCQISPELSGQQLVSNVIG